MMSVAEHYPPHPLRPGRADDDADHLASLAKALGHPARVKIIKTLMRREVCIGCDIVEEIGLAASTTSEHLRILKAAGLVIGEIERPRVCYSLNPDAVAPLMALLSQIKAGPSATIAAHSHRPLDHCGKASTNSNEAEGRGDGADPSEEEGPPDATKRKRRPRARRFRSALDGDPPFRRRHTRKPYS